MLVVGEIAKTSTVTTIALQPLAPINFQHLVADTLGCNDTVASPLAELTYRKTQGNPFFATQFLKALHQDKLISFDRQNNFWECDLTQIVDTISSYLNAKGYRTVWASNGSEAISLAHSEFIIGNRHKQLSQLATSHSPYPLANQE